MIHAVEPLSVHHQTQWEQRRLFIVDIENIVGGAMLVTEEGAKQARHILEVELGLRSDEQVILAVTADQCVFPVARAFPGKTLRVRHGESGADLALIDSVDPAHVGARYDEALIISGDGIFTSLAVAIGYTGVRVTAAAYEARMSARLRLACHYAHFFQTPHTAEKAIA